jgi:hypothetical protein
MERVLNVNDSGKIEKSNAILEKFYALIREENSVSAQHIKPS